jgi:hypothetical protein
LPDLPFDVAQNLSPLLVKAERPRRPGKSLTLNVPQQIEDGVRPGASIAPDCLTDTNDPRVRTAFEGNSCLIHTSG